MNRLEHRWGLSFVCAATLWVALPISGSAAEPTRYLRFEKEAKVAYGILEGERVREIEGDLFGEWEPTETVYPLSEIKILTPTEPKQVLALAGNYRSHLGQEEIPPKLRIPQPFYKSLSSLVGQGEAIEIPKDAKTVHYEAELVIVIGKTCRNVSKEQAMDYVFGVTAGNDISERIWQNDEEVKDVQWWRAKGADTFGPVGPYIATGLDYGNLMMRLRLNGEVKQEESTDHLIHDIPATVSFISQYVTLHPGDLIFTGTPGETSEIQPGDVVEVELEGVGVLRNPVKAEE
ncbi:fumarylacetoacetate hydrolase family protein [Candidatus Laterigemmans baculatus]|uniref:fumarylacetoacetate hydrolase family protein n=1 Tax=Candidatus Laterigemmans baculatus TaxID=2770505 RepID=UPI0013D9DC2C|nr:fumarylacetoacetate hydrolase family protein [Candidatus Laterigemmans baculatus]